MISYQNNSSLCFTWGISTRRIMWIMWMAQRTQSQWTLCIMCCTWWNSPKRHMFNRWNGSEIEVSSYFMFILLNLLLNQVMLKLLNFFSRSSKGDLLAADKSVSVPIYMTTIESSASLWRFVNIGEGNNTINLQNVGNWAYLHRTGQYYVKAITTYPVGIGNVWKVHGTLQYSNKISLESFMGDFLFRTNAK